MPWIDTLYYYMGFDISIEPKPETVKQRHLVMKQIKLSKVKLKSVYKKKINKTYKDALLK